MSLPKQVPFAARPASHSSSPSKSSLRSQKSAAERRSLPSPHFEEDVESPTPEPQVPEVAIEEEEEGEGEIHSRIEENEVHDFQPLFTLLHDTQASEHYHPTVHYIFADDDTDIITEAALRSLEDEDGGDEPYEHESPAAKDTEGRPAVRAPKQHVKEHYILVDVAPTYSSATEANTSIGTNETSKTIRQGPLPLTASVPSSSVARTDPKHPWPYHIVSASSLSPSFAVLSAEIAQAPTFDPPSPVATTKNRRLSSAEANVQGLGIHASGTGLSSDAAAASKSDNDTRGIPLMLKIQGVSAFEAADGEAAGSSVQARHGKGKTTSSDTATQAEQHDGQPEESLEDLVWRFEERLAQIKKVVDAASGNQY